MSSKVLQMNASEAGILRSVEFYWNWLFMLQISDVFHYAPLKFIFDPELVKEQTIYM